MKKEERSQMILEHAKMLANSFSVRNGYKSVEEALVEMAKFVDNNPQSPMISIKDERPKVGQTVYTYETLNTADKEPRYNKSTYLGRDRWSQEDGDYTCEFSGQVTHWMPLPEIDE